MPIPITNVRFWMFPWISNTDMRQSCPASSFFCRSMLLSSRRELGLIMKFMGEALTEREIQMIIDEADVDHDGLIDYTEFFSMMNPK